MGSVLFDDCRRRNAIQVENWMIDADFVPNVDEYIHRGFDLKRSGDRLKYTFSAQLFADNLEPFTISNILSFHHKWFKYLNNSTDPVFSGTRAQGDKFVTIPSMLLRPQCLTSMTSPICVLCDTGQDMTAAHLDECSALNYLNCIVKRVAINSGPKNPKDLLTKRRVSRHKAYENWKWITQSDESHYTLFCPDGRCQIWGEPQEAMNPSGSTRTVQGSGGSIMIWNMFCWQGSGGMVFLEGNTNASRTNLAKLDRVQSSAARIITGMRHSCPTDLVLFEADIMPLDLRRKLLLSKSELIAIDEALRIIKTMTSPDEIWILCDSRSAIQHLSDWINVGYKTSVSILKNLKELSQQHEIYFQWIPSHIGLFGNDTADLF
ncbi:RNase H domain-containing protein [Trichonephila clavipes]|uniref:RNase H domain-containing protein n=1 Tax=Trichonephila clavipes TaxID=2585209 RepID=A0A8X6VSR5_TRICX|nr:RNase H domain-containing protein [Trichonephila clavipes]